MFKKIASILILMKLFLLSQLYIVSADDANTILQIYDIYPDQVVMKGFTLNKKLEIEIQATVGIVEKKNYMLSACWILNAENRALVWECSVANSKIIARKRELKYQGKLNLIKGSYEVYYSLNPTLYLDVDDILNQVFKGSKKSRSSQEWGVTVKLSHGEAELQFVHEYIPPQKEPAFVQITKLRDNQLSKKGFSISRPLKLRLYAIGEGSKKNREVYDYGWIIDANSRERIWEMSHRNTEHAGGALKNIKFDDIIRLPAGDYLVYFVTDDSHSPKKWNALPPYDPNHWGITLWSMEKNGDKGAVKEYEEFEPEPIIELTHIRNYQFEMDGFTLKRDADLRIFALGEYSRSRGKFVDYGWIVDVYSREKVWQMDYKNTEHAGGGKKNRVFDNVVNFQAGSYLVYYITDDSHAYKSWNVQKPLQQEAWGITIYPAEKNLSPDDVQKYREDNDRNILAQIIRVRNKEKLIVNFSLDQPAKIRIYAIGEGDRREMYDYGWIEDGNGYNVWKMKYKETKHAGGSRKNRLFNNVITLEKGDYLVRYKSDDSHCYRKWNDTPPEDRIHWGITVIKAE